MNQYEDLDSSAAYLAGRSAARELRDTGAGPDHGPKHQPRGLHPEDEVARLWGWRSYFS